jgi:hypothetical protein
VIFQDATRVQKALRRNNQFGLWAPNHTDGVNNPKEKEKKNADEVNMGMFNSSRNVKYKISTTLE